MREALRVSAPLSLCLLAACAGGLRERSELEPGKDLAAYRRLAVLPATGKDEPARALRAGLERSLYEAGFDVVPPQALDATFAELGVAPGDTMGPSTLEEVRRRTKAQALVSADLSCPRSASERRVTVLFLDGRDGSVVWRLSFKPTGCSQDAAALAAQHAAAQVQRALGPKAPGRRADEETLFLR
ncbi:MAG: hypothetical protein HYV15_05325 [Elusimicrobia bacterium]|nr:hypothetical protein [Elusimicrobiota bacterium]